MITWEAEITCNDRESGERHVTITKLSFDIPENEPETE